MTRTVETVETMETRAERAQRLSARHTVVLTVTVSVMAVFMVLAGLNWLEILPSPFARDFSRAPTAVETIEIACPPADALPVPFDQVTVNVYNGAGAEGLARSTAEQLAMLVFQTGEIANWTERSPVPALIISGPDGLAHAYTLALTVPEAMVTPDSRKGESVDLVLGNNAPALVTPDVAATLPLDQPFVAPQGCE